MADAENRRSPRVARSFMARYRVTRTQDTLWLVSPLRDLSSGGARFLSERATLVAGDLLEMQLILPTAQQPLPLTARIAWIKQGPLSMVEVGVTFDPGDSAIQQMIDAAVTHFLRKQ